MNYSLYFHLPFCTHRCAYCDFNTYAGQEALIPAYVEALCREIKFVGAHLPSSAPPFRPPISQFRNGGMEGGRRAGGSPQHGGEVHTLFFGGGTPSLLSPKQFEQILQAIHASFDLRPSDPSGPSGMVETSLEANPGTVTLDSLRELRRLGFNRISFGVQSAHPDELHQLERIHDFFDVVRSVEWARRAGFDNLNLDLIYGLPEQTLSRWQESLRRLVDLGPEHLSLYALTIEHGTPFGRWAARGLLPLPDPDLAADMYEWAGEYLEGQGYEQYEISNWSKPGFQCKHNLQYWRNQPYLGFGAGAHGCAAGLRVANVLRIKTYLARLSPDHPIPDYLVPNPLTPNPLIPDPLTPNPLTPNPLIPNPLIPDHPIPDHLFPNYLIPNPLSPAIVTRTSLTPHIEMQETMMLGLRLTQEGVSAAAFRERFGQEMRSVFAKEIGELERLGLLEWAGDVLRLTPHARLVGNQVFLRFVGE